MNAANAEVDGDGHLRAVALVLVAAVFHAAWNLTLHRGGIAVAGALLTMLLAQRHTTAPRNRRRVPGRGRIIEEFLRPS